jgi:hypothetical protein
MCISSTRENGCAARWASVRDGDVSRRAFAGVDFRWRFAGFTHQGEQVIEFG